MEKILRVTNALLAVIALCLVLLVASVYRQSFVATAHAQLQPLPQGDGYGKAQPVYLVYLDKYYQPQPVVGQDGQVPTKQ